MTVQVDSTRATRAHHVMEAKALIFLDVPCSLQTVTVHHYENVPIPFTEEQLLQQKKTHPSDPEQRT